ncbi:Acetyltransferase (GNAT) domain-containing protein [Mycolicibacterium rutilum]|uniref:Acetyltransferase (GNAT) domain-containing protein n=1 Tax=Mycolicibacterium rutilum TaxID=370526 RepID=A0A1H6L821_MYCRU|nr:GNAT family N-acetyltransferase [Mycolicibacterium rutilum]SEH84408.1 Acetyltransferase (GNAT) domain-containing protein [Mycolicibacterium rutilum]
MGGGVVLSVRNDVTGYWSKALGFGFTEPVTPGLIDRVIDFYRAERSRGAVVQIAPEVLPDDWPRICERHGFKPDAEIYKLGCSVDDVQPGPVLTAPDARVGLVGPADAEAWATATLRGFGMPTDGLSDMITASAKAGDTHQFAAWVDGEIVATGNLLVHGSIGLLNAGATLPAFRNRGLQTALIAARIAAAAEAGCRWIVAEAEKPAEGADNPSLNNLRRAGLRPLYARRNWVWSP